MKKRAVPWVREYERQRTPQTVATDVRAAYGSNPWFYSCIRRVADSASQLDLVVYDRSGDPVDGPPDLRRLVDAPNPFTPPTMFTRDLVSRLPLDGDVYILLDWLEGMVPPTAEPPSRPPRELHILSDCRPVGSDDGRTRVTHYEVNGRHGQPLEVHPRRVVHISEFSAVGDLTGTGAGEVLARYTLPLEAAANRWNVDGFEHGGAHQRVVFSHPHNPSESQIRIWLNRVMRRFFGAKNANKPLAMTGGWKAETIGSGHKDMEFAALRSQNVMEIAAALGVPPSVVGILEHANYSNMEVQERLLWELTIIPLLSMIEGYLNLGLVSPYFPGFRLGYDLSGVKVLQENIGDAIETAVKLRNAGLATINELRAYLTDKGFAFTGGDVEGGDVIYVPFTQLPLSTQTGTPGPWEPKLGEEMEEGDASRAFAAGEWIEKGLADAGRNATKQIHARQQLLLARRFERDVRSILTELERVTLSTIDGAKWYEPRAKGLSTKLVHVSDGYARGCPACGAEPVDIEYVEMASTGKAAEYTVADVERLLVDTAEMAQELAREKATQFHAGAVKLRAEDVLAELGLDAAVLDMTSPEVQTFLSRKVQAFAGNWPETVLRRLRGSLIEGTNAGETINELQTRVRQVMKVERARALTIARTEATPAFNFGSQVAYAESGVVDLKEWLDAADGEVRETHMSVAAVPVSDPFVVGGESLLYPGDPGGSPGNIINCRCTTVPVVRETV